MIRSGPEGNTLCLLWLLMLTEAGKCNRGGYLMISDSLPYTEETLNILTGISLSTVRLGLIAFANLGMIDRKDGAIFIKNWRKYQSEDKLEARRAKDRLRQQRHRQKERKKLQALPSPDQVSRDVTLENRQDKNRVDKTTTEQTRLLLSGTPLAEISDRELASLAKKHSAQILLLAADIAAETWRRNREDKHNPGGYLNALCTSLIIPDWYVPFEERQKKEEEALYRHQAKKEEQSATHAQEEEKKAALNVLWQSLSDEQQKAYRDKASANLPKTIKASMEIITIMAKSIAWQETETSSQD